MSKTSKLTAKVKQLQQKRKIKAANKAKYEALRQAGQNSKSKRSILANKKKRLISFIDHPNGNCGNIACKKCT